MQVPVEGKSVSLESERQTAGLVWRESLFCSLFEVQAQQNPQKTAIVFDTQALTYRQLNERANQLAHYLRNHGIGADTLVGVCLERSLEMAIAVLGILKAGAAYVPLDPSYPPERTRFILSDAQPKLVVTSKAFRDGVGETAPLLLMDLERSALDAQPDADLSDTGVQTNHLAYVIYTSGSTGTPKGVGIELRNVISLLEALQAELKITDQDIWLGVSPLSFDIAFAELFLPLMAGATLVIASAAAARDGKQLHHLLRRTSATVMQATPSTWRLLLDAGWHPHPDFKVVCGGEAMPVDLAGLLSQKTEWVWNVYGPTETTIWSTAYKLTGRESGRIPIGRALQNTEIYILDGNLKPLPVGVAGELYIAGRGLARGYLNQPALTHERFLPNPFGKQSYRSMYKTGDLGRWIGDGNIEYLGRVDDQIKLRGHRIELGEIDANLTQHVAVKAAITVAREFSPDDKRLVAYLIPKQNSTISPSEIAKYLRGKLPDYMVPAHFVVLNSFPLLPNGKIDRSALPFPEKAPHQKGSEPCNYVETQLIAIWQDVLQTSDIQPPDNFFDLGGHSYLAVKLFAQVERIFGLRLPLSTLLQAPTVEQLAEVIAHDSHRSKWTSLVALQLGKTNPGLFLVPGVGGDVLGLADLARFLGRDMTVYGLQSRGLDGLQEPSKTIKEIAQNYLKEIRQVQASGPYFLAGFCVGGMVAFEMAQQLTASGEKVALLALMDTFPPATVRRSPEARRIRLPRRFDAVSFLSQRLTYHIRQIVRMSPRRWFRQFGRGFRVFKEMIEQQDIYRGDRPLVLRQLVSQANLKAAAQYVPKPYPGSIQLFVATERKIDGSDDPRLHWQHLAKGCDVNEVAVGDSGLMMRMPQLADQLRARLCEARRKFET